MAIRLEKADREMVERYVADLAAIHQRAFDDSDHLAEQYRTVEIPTMAAASGMQAVIAFDDDAPIGFVLGHDSSADDEWFGNMRRAVDGSEIAGAFDDSWYLAEIAVDPAFQSQGIGRRLVDKVLAQVGDRFCVLVTWCAPHPAHAFYLEAGWREVIPDLRYKPDSDPTSVLIKDQTR